MMAPRRPADPYLLLAPTLGLLTLFFFYPLAYAALTSLYAWDLLTPPRYVGLGHYRSLFASGEITRVLLNTGLYSVVVVVLSMALGLMLALALRGPGRIVAFVRSAVFSAYVVSWVSVALLFTWMLDADNGLVSAVVRGVGLQPLDWLGDPRVALTTLALVTVWKIAGYSMVLFIAGLQDIPPSLREAAALDGAGDWRSFWHVTWPLLRPTAAFVGTTSLIATFQAFDIVRVMTQGGPVSATTVFVYAIYEQIFMNLRVGRASAEVMIFFVLLLGLTAFQLWAWRYRARA